MNKVLICNLGDDIMVYFPTNENEISLIKFIAKYQYLNVNNAKYFFDTSRYYRNRIKNLIDKCYNGIYLAKYNFCEYTNYKDIYINTFYFIDTEKINRFKYFINESSNKRAYISL